MMQTAQQLAQAIDQQGGTAYFVGGKIVKAEIAKCDVRCSNCHIKRTTKQFNWWKLDLDRFR